MSEFQLSLLGIGVIVVIAVFGYGYWQQWSYRRSLGRAPDEQGVKANTNTLRDKNSNTSINDPFDANGTHHFIDEPAQDSFTQPDDKTDYIVSMTFKFPHNAQVLDGFWQRRFDYGKTVLACGCNTASGNWERLIPESPSTYREIKVAVQLVDRNGAISDTRLSDFRELLGDIGRKLDADIVLPVADLAVERARELDTFCASVDQMIGINIFPDSQHGIFGSEVARAMLHVGMSLQADGTYHLFDDTGATLFTLSASDGKPFQHHTLDQLRVASLTLLLDIPRVTEPVARFDEMILLAREVATLLRATLVDDQRVFLGDAAIAQIRAQVESVEARMLAGGLSPGGEQALRLFN